MPKVKLLFAWYDLWVGFYWDRIGRKLYFLPIPCFGIVFSFKKSIEDKKLTCKSIIVNEAITTLPKREDPSRG
jgi:hypothetical protein